MGRYKWREQTCPDPNPLHLWLCKQTPWDEWRAQKQAGGRARTPAQVSQLSILCSLYWTGFQKILVQKTDQYKFKGYKKNLSCWPKDSSTGVTNGLKKKKMQESGEATAERFLSFTTDWIDRGAFWHLAFGRGWHKFVRGLEIQADQSWESWTEGNGTGIEALGPIAPRLRAGRWDSCL